MRPKLPRWTQRPDVLAYVIDCYAGTDTIGDGRKKRRVFLWEDGDMIKMGNTEAFALHLAARYDLIINTALPATLHALLRALGEDVQLHKPHAPRGIAKKAFKQPDAEEWVVGRVTPIEEED